MPCIIHALKIIIIRDIQQWDWSYKLSFVIAMPYANLGHGATCTAKKLFPIEAEIPNFDVGTRTMHCEKNFPVGP
jgi:hypothetical protein